MLLPDLRSEMVLQSAADLAHSLVDAPLVARFRRLEPQRNRIAHAARTDLLAAIDVEQTQLVEGRPGTHAGDPQDLSHGRSVVHDDREVPVDRLRAGNRADPRLGQYEVEEAVRIDEGVHGPAGEAPRVDDARVDLAE